MANPILRWSGTDVDERLIKVCEPTGTGPDYADTYQRRLEEAEGRVARSQPSSGPRPGNGRGVLSLLLASSDAIAGGDLSAYRRLEPVVPRDNRAGRNEPCPCGSGRKRKHCHKE